MQYKMLYGGNLITQLKNAEDLLVGQLRVP